MPYTNLQAAFTLGIINLVLNLMKCLVAIAEGSDGKIIADGIIGALLCGLLIYGSHQHKTFPITIWMILSIIESIFLGKLIYQLHNFICVLILKLMDL